MMIPEGNGKMAQGIRLLFGVLGLIASGAAFAHVGVHADGGLTSGLAHPFMGLDHLLAMVAVGIWAAQLGGRHLLILPATFVATMAVGAAAAMHGLPLPLVESMVALSVLVLGMLVALGLRASGHWAALLVALVALFHGHAHGTEMPEFSAPWLYFAGFALATATLHAIGVSAGAALKTHAGFLRAGGAAIGLAGSWLLVSGLM
jgi:urease accessory protein